MRPRASAKRTEKLNRKFAGEEADLTWPQYRRIVELDGPQFHLDATEDLRKQRKWEAAGWTVDRLPTDDVYPVPSACSRSAHKSARNFPHRRFPAG